MNEKMNYFKKFEYDIIKELEIDDNIRTFLQKDENKFIFKEVAHDGKVRLKATQHVGLVQINDIIIEVLPKLYKDKEHSDLALKNFLFLLNYTSKFHNLKYFDNSELHDKGSIFEVLIFLFAKNLFELLKVNPNRNYIVVEDESNFLKGSWRLGEQLSRAPHLKHRFYVAYNEFTDNNLLNQIFKFVSQMLVYKTKNVTNRYLLQNILLFMTEIDDIPYPNRATLQRVKFTRFNNVFERVFNLAKMFLEKLASSGNNPKSTSFSFMFDMNRLFEEFIAEFILREKLIQSRLKMKTQVSSKYLANKEKKEKKEEVFLLKPDISFWNDEKCELIIDTKYKLLEEKEDKKQGVAESDAYQMFAYARKYDCNRIILLYPKHIQNKSGDFDFDDGYKLEIRTVDLCRDLIKDKKVLKEELIGILNQTNKTNTIKKVS